MHKVEVMSQVPSQCMYCGRGNTPDDPDGMDDFWAVDLERDRNWGDSTYLCKYCCDTLAAVSGYITMDQLREVEQVNEHLKERIHDLEAKLQERERRLDQIVTGARAVRKTKKERGVTKTKKVA